MRPSLVLFLGLSLGCSSSSVVLPRLPALSVRGEPVGAVRPPGTLYRDEVERAIQAGLGYFLQRVDVRAVTRNDDSGRRAFVGFEILSLRPAMDWLAFDFAPGDILTKVDGVSVEHYDSVIPMFEGLAAKDRFAVELIRAGEPKTVLISIQSRGGAQPQASGTPVKQVTPQ